MAMDFPNSPTVGQTYTVGDKTWKWTASSTWEIVASRPPMRTVSDTPPASPISADEWFNSLTGRTYIWFDNFWVEQNTNSVVGANGLNGVASASAPLVYNNTNNNISVQSTPVFSGSVGVNVAPAVNTGNYAALHVASNNTGAAIARFTRGATGHNATDGLIVGTWDDGTNFFYTYEAEPIVMSTTGTERLRIAATGQITMPNQPAIYLDGNTGWITQTLNTPIKTFTNIFSRGGMTWDSVNGRVTVPVAGYYRVYYQQYRGAGASYNRVWIRRNGNTNYGHLLSGGDTSADSIRNLSCIVPCSANDYIEVYQGDPTTSCYYGSIHSFATIELLG